MSLFKWALVGDLQIPYEDKRAVALWFKVMKSWKPDAIDVLGDISDFLEFSSFSDGTTDEFFARFKKDETLNAVDYLIDSAVESKVFYQRIRKEHPKADIHVSQGNHEARIFKYVNRKAPELLPFVNFDTLWDFTNLGITTRHYDERPFERFAGVHAHHGVTTSTTGPTILKNISDYDLSLVRGHSHLASIATKTYPLSGRELVGMETGHMCDPTAYGLKYTINPDWQKGFGVGYIHGEHVQLQFIPITPEYTCVLDGKIYSG